LKKREREKRSERERPKKTDDVRSAKQDANKSVKLIGSGNASEQKILIGIVTTAVIGLVTEGVGKEWTIRGMSANLP
jgi:hypothetical protein